jgi:TIR domain/inactive STAND
MALVFISYRREDIQPALILSGQLGVAFRGADEIFFDQNSIEPGDKWPEHIRAGASQCSVFIVLVGPGWVSASNRLKNKADWVRLEILYGVNNPDVTVLPLFVGGIKGFEKVPLPKALHQLRERQSKVISDDNLVEGYKNFAEYVRLLCASELDGRGRSIRPMPISLPYWCDRSDQEDRVGIALRDLQNSKERDIIFVLEGHEREGHSGFLDRLKDNGSIQRYLGESPQIHLVNWDSSKIESTEIESSLRKSIATALLLPADASNEAIRTRLRSGIQPIILLMSLKENDTRVGSFKKRLSWLLQMCRATVLGQIKSNKVRECDVLSKVIQAWQSIYHGDAGDIATNGQSNSKGPKVLLWVNATYLREFDLKELQRAESSENKTRKVVLPKLQPVGRFDVAFWADLPQVKDHIKGKSKQIAELFKNSHRVLSSETMHMDDFADEIWELLHSRVSGER